MSRPETIHIERHMTKEELDRQIKTGENDTRILKRLFFVRHRYEGKSVKEAAELSGTAKCNGYIWQRRWNEDGYEGLKPRHAGGTPPRLSEEQKEDLKETLGTGSYTLKEIRDIISERYDVEYSLKRVGIIMKKMGMKCAKPYRHDHRRPADAEKMLKKKLRRLDGCVIGFLDEASPQTTSNTVRRWSFRRPEVWKNTTKIKSNTFGFYALNGRSAVYSPERSKTEDVCDFLEKISKANPGKRIVVVLDNFNAHTAAATRATAERLNIRLVFLPPYSPDLNPIEYIWKSIKRVISSTFVEDREHMTDIIAAEFRKLSESLSFAGYWIKRFMGGKISIKA